MDPVLSSLGAMLVLAAPICGIYSAVVASVKGYSGFGWFCAGLFFPFIGLIAAAGLPMNPHPPVRFQNPQQPR